MEDYLAIATALVQRLEACKLSAYSDSVGVWTLGYGHTAGVKRGDTCTQDQAATWLCQDLAVAEDRLNTATFGSTTPLTAHQRAALISSVHNAGCQRGWHIWQDVRSGNLVDVPHQMLRFVYGAEHGQEVIIPGLMNRRRAEIAVWNTPDT
jgi:lysozyme